MSDDIVMRALFSQQRAQIIFMRSVNKEVIPDAYAYAWVCGVYPVSHDGDDSVPQRPHQSYEKYFIVSKNFATEVLDYLDDCWMSGNSPTFYELEDKFGGRCVRSKLIHICRYAYLEGAFDDRLWNALLKPMQYPTEAGSIASEFKDSELYIL